jgi:hypothetical protein
MNHVSLPPAWQRRVLRDTDPPPFAPLTYCAGTELLPRTAEAFDPALPALHIDRQRIADPSDRNKPLEPALASVSAWEEATVSRNALLSMVNIAELLFLALSLTCAPLILIIR